MSKGNQRNELAEIAYMLREARKRGYEQMRRAKAEKRVVVWGQLYNDLTTSQGIATIRNDPYVGWVARDAKPLAKTFCEVAEAEGFSPSICVYQRIQLGNALLLARGETDRIPEEFLLPKPDYILMDSDCPIRLQAAKAFGDILKVPIFIMEHPYSPEEWPYPQDIAFMTKQREELVRFVEEITGHAFDWDAWKKLRLGVRDIRTLIAECQSRTRNIPSPVPFEILSELGVLSRAFVVPVDEGKELCRQVLTMIDRWLEQGIGCVADERHRLYFVGSTWRNSMDALVCAAAANNAAVVSFEQSGRLSKTQGDRDRETPQLASLQRISDQEEARLWYKTTTFPLSWERRVARFLQEGIEGYGVDGIVAFDSKTCRPRSLGILDLVDEARRRYGLSTTLLECDTAELGEISPIAADLQTFIESMPTKGEPSSK